MPLGPKSYLALGIFYFLLYSSVFCSAYFIENNLPVLWHYLQLCPKFLNIICVGINISHGCFANYITISWCIYSYSIIRIIFIYWFSIKFFLLWFMLGLKETQDKSHLVPLTPPSTSHQSMYPKLSSSGLGFPYRSLWPLHNLRSLGYMPSWSPDALCFLSLWFFYHSPPLLISLSPFYFETFQMPLAIFSLISKMNFFLLYTWKKSSSLFII